MAATTRRRLRSTAVAVPAATLSASSRNFSATVRAGDTGVSSRGLALFSFLRAMFFLTIQQRLRFLCKDRTFAPKNNFYRLRRIAPRYTASVEFKE
jgi:hypothetical protein